MLTDLLPLQKLANALHRLSVDAARGARHAA